MRGGRAGEAEGARGEGEAEGVILLRVSDLI